MEGRKGMLLSPSALLTEGHLPHLLSKRQTPLLPAAALSGPPPPEYWWPFWCLLLTGCWSSCGFRLLSPEHLLITCGSCGSCWFAVWGSQSSSSPSCVVNVVHWFLKFHCLSFYWDLGRTQSSPFPPRSSSQNLIIRVLIQVLSWLLVHYLKGIAQIPIQINDKSKWHPSFTSVVCITVTVTLIGYDDYNHSQVLGCEKCCESRHMSGSFGKNSRAKVTHGYIFITSVTCVLAALPL